MTVERALLVGVTRTPSVDELVADIGSAADRARKAEPGERGDIVRFEALSTQLELLAQCEASTGLGVPIEGDDIAQLPAFLKGSPTTWPDTLPHSLRAQANVMASDGLLPVVLASALNVGQRPDAAMRTSPPEPAKVWRSPDDVRGREAVEKRFTDQIAAAIADRPDESGQASAISPSGIQNPIVTETLREFVELKSGEPPCLVPVEYRDGSRSAHPFALRSLHLRPIEAGDDIDGHYDLELRFSLLSIRHTEMDAVVDGSWLRNAQISRPRPAAQTDDLVYDITRRQLGALATGTTSVLIHLYQTGLEPAVVGFYKALADHLLAHPGSVAVQPMFYCGGRGPRHGQRGPKNRRNQDRQRPEQTAHTPVVVDGAPFRKGRPWMM